MALWKKPPHLAWVRPAPQTLPAFAKLLVRQTATNSPQSIGVARAIGVARVQPQRAFFAPGGPRAIDQRPHAPLPAGAQVGPGHFGHEGLGESAWGVIEGVVG